MSGSRSMMCRWWLIVMPGRGSVTPQLGCASGELSLEGTSDEVLSGSRARGPGRGPRVRRVMTVLSAAVLIGLYGYSLPAVYDYVSFMKVQSTSYLKIRFDALYSIYIIFVLAVIARYAWLGWRAVVSGRGTEIDPEKAGSGAL